MPDETPVPFADVCEAVGAELTACPCQCHDAHCVPCRDQAWWAAARLSARRGLHAQGGELRTLTLDGPAGRRDGYVRCRRGKVEFRYADDHVWFRAQREQWECFTPEDLRAIADAKEHADD